MTSSEVVLRFEGDRWCARGDGIACEHPELVRLDALLSTHAESAGIERVHVRFDLSSLPSWLRQYHAHYCNYVLHVVRRS